MKLYKLIIFSLIVGCSPKISEHFGHNRYVGDYGKHISNDSLKMYFRSPGDIKYTTDKKHLKEILKKKDLSFQGKVVVHGKTATPPYEYFVTIAQNSNLEKSEHEVVFDTVIQNNTIRFIGKPLTEGAAQYLRINLEPIFHSLEVGSGYRKDISSVMDVVKEYSDSNRFLAALTEIQNYPAYDEQEEWAKFQMELTFASFLGDNHYYRELLKELESRFKTRSEVIKTIQENGVSNVKAIEKIVEEAEKHRIVMVNENHFYPNHRILVADLLPQLKKIGYRYLALETLSAEQDSLLNLENKFPTLKTGFYTSEQNYSNLLRKAKALGFEFIAYENTKEEKNREVGQAENLFNRTFGLDPKAKVVVLAGLDHILEKPTKSGREWMATIFSEKYGIDPLTISQSHLNPYRKQVPDDYHLLSSKHFEDDRLSSVDFHLLNNKSKFPSEWDSIFSCQNKAPFEVQIALFYGLEINNEYDYHKKVPYYTSILEKGEVVNLPVDGGQEIYLYTYDNNGKRIDKEIIITRTDQEQTNK